LAARLGLRAVVDVVEAVCEQDLAYLEANPEVEEFIRERIPGEFAPLSDDAFQRLPLVRVRRRGPGVMSRQAFSVIPNRHDEAMALAAELYRNGQGDAVGIYFDNGDGRAVAYRD
jgi:hypothetical protein